ncbi:zinc finger MYM-type protein 1-like [Dendronephthya gigantea]|uniref:zinc finger MYM-type protein 1-like n=1 Tax=Dendronephthya gigantea TaxID=151771 RepID=UPI00106D3262|nr:zinc finger MYM-type protein 1-like [Dendronephthya gigantea]
MPRKNAPKPAKRAKLSGIRRFFKDPQQVEQTSTLASHASTASSDSGNDLPSTPLTPIVNERQCNVIHVDNPPTSLAEFVENDEAESQGISCAAISRPSLPNEQPPSSEASGSSDFLTSNRCSPATVSALSPLTAKSNNIMNLDKPNHPKVSVIPAQKLSTRTLYFQSKWYEDYEWIHYDPDLKKILCFHCSKASAMGINDLAHYKDPAFISEGFNNWKKAIEKFKLHQTSHTHVLSVNQIAAVKRPSVSAQIHTQKQKEQAIARTSLLKLFTSIRYLLRQGSAFRGHNENDGSYSQLLKLRTEDVPDLQMYLRNTTNFTSPCAQNEMIEMFSHQILRKIVSDIQQNEFYAVTADGTQDISGQEQESFCLRHVDSDLYVHEDFIGLYEVPSTTGDILARTLFDVLARSGLSISNMRAQTYDGAANMSGCYSGCKAIVQERQPLALFFHCGSHASNLVMQHAVTSCQLIRDSLQWLNELGVLMKRSGKYKAIFLAICESTEDDNLHPTAIKPLCATRWLCRLAAIESALDRTLLFSKVWKKWHVVKRTLQPKQMVYLIGFRRERSFLG